MERIEMVRRTPGTDRVQPVQKEKVPPEFSGPVEVVAGNMERWLLMLGVGLGGVGIAAAFMGLLVVAFTLASIVLVSITIFLFIRFWPEEEVPERRVSPPSPGRPRPRQAMVQAVRVDGPPRARLMMSLKEVVRRQESFRISQQGAEAFAKTIRYILRSQR